MPLKAVTFRPESPAVMNVFCSQLSDGWRVYLNPEWVPAYLLRSFDENLEAYPVHIDLDDLDQYMRFHQSEYEKRVSGFGGVELTARGDAAHALAAWLSTAFASGERITSKR
jgi:hypothetical protein